MWCRRWLLLSSRVIKRSKNCLTGFINREAGSKPRRSGCSNMSVRSVRFPRWSSSWFIRIRTRWPASAWAKIANSKQLAQLAAIENDSALQRHLLASLVGRGTPQSIELYLNFVEDRRTGDAALSALDKVHQPPTQAFFAILTGPHAERRLAAARVLGQIDGPIVTRQLAQMVLANVNRREAMAALASSGGAHAIDFVRQAERDQSLAAVVRSARSQLKTLLRSRIMRWSRMICAATATALVCWFGALQAQQKPAETQKGKDSGNAARCRRRREIRPSLQRRGLGLAAERTIRIVALIS